MTAVFFLQKPLPWERGLPCPGLPWVRSLEKTVSPTAGLSRRLKGFSEPPWHHLLSSPISINNTTRTNETLQALCCFRYFKELQLLHISFMPPGRGWAQCHPRLPSSNTRHRRASGSLRLCTDLRGNAGWPGAQLGRLLPPYTPQVKPTLSSEQHETSLTKAENLERFPVTSDNV